MSILRQAVRHSGCLQEPVSTRIAALAQSQLTCSAVSAEQQRSFTGSSQCYSPVHIEDEPYCRQRQLIVLGNRVPELAPDSWVAPNAVVIGDVDIFDKVRRLCSRSCRCVKPLSARQYHKRFSFNTHTLSPDIFANPCTAILCYGEPGSWLMLYPEPAPTMCAGQYLVWSSLARGPERYPRELLLQHPGQDHYPCSQVRSHPL